MSDNNAHEIIVQRFINLEYADKIDYIRKIKLKPRRFTGMTLSQLLLLYEPRILEIKENWVDSLLFAEAASFVAHGSVL